MIVALPSLRRKILRSFLMTILLYAVLGMILVASVFISSGTTPRLLHRNYDSISASGQMRQAWNAIEAPSDLSVALDLRVAASV